ncbi:MAG: hypothetical protein WC183_03920 [Methanosarcina sp.]
MRRGAYPRCAIREGQRTPDAQFGKDSVLPMRNSGRTAYSRAAIREGQRTPEPQFGVKKIIKGKGKVPLPSDRH